MQQPVGWEPVYPPPRLPRLECGVLELRKKLNEEAKLPSCNYWKIRASWYHVEHEDSYYYNLEDSYRGQWSVRIYKKNYDDCWKYEKLQKGYFDPETT